MEYSRSIRKNNSGSTLILVVICTAYIAILCSVLLSMSLSNREMKNVERKTKSNFYTAETAMDEIRTGLENLAADALESAYIDVMEQYIGKSEEEKRKLLAQIYLQELEAALCTTPGGDQYRRELLTAMVTNSSAVLATAEGENLLERDISDPDEQGELILKNVKVSYLDVERYHTTITTDIVISTPDAGVISRENASSVYSRYGLIADQGISLQTAVGVEISGNVYAGEGGINLDNCSELYINNGDQVVTRGDIGVKERSTLHIEGNPSVWARNILTRRGSDTEEETAIHIKGRCLVADDLTLDARASSVTLEGEYYGFSYGAHWSKEEASPLYADNSSAILVNGRDSYLNLARLRTLLITGRAYVDPTLDGNAAADIYTGEAITVKENQAAYLVPAQFLWCGVNPVPDDIYQAYHGAPTGEPEVDFDKEISTPFPIRLSDYADGFLNLFYEVSGGQRYVYYYLRFRSEAHANAYMQEYYRVFQKGMGIGILDFDRSMDRNTDRILVNDSLGSIISSGNIFTYNSTEKSTLHPNTVDPKRGSETEGSSYLAMEQVARQLAGQYDSICRSLEPVASYVPYDESSLFQSILRTEELADISGASAITVGEYVLYIVNNAVGTPYEFDFVLPTDVSLPHQGRKGIVIATGNVVVSGEYHGLILSGKDIRLNSGAKVITSDRIVEAVIGAGNPEVNRFFRVVSSTGTSRTVNSISISELISFRNWERNED